MIVFDLWGGGQLGRVDIKADYSPTHVDGGALWAGKYQELINLVPVEGLELTLKPIHEASVQG